MFPFRKILIGATRREGDDGLAAYAAMLAALAPEAEFHFVHVLAPPARHETSPVTHQEAVLQLRALAGRHLGPDASERVACHVISGVRVDRLLEFAAEGRFDLLLIGHHQEHGGRRSLARRLAMKAPASVWMVPNGSAPRLSRVVAAVDFSPNSAQALTAAAAITKAAQGAACLAFHVYFDDAVARFDEYSQIVRGNEEAVWKNFSAPLDLGGVKVEARFEESPSVARAISRFAGAQPADLVVMGTRGQSPAAAVLLGSESEQVIMESRIPVLVVKEPGHRIGILSAILDRDFRSRPAARFG